MTIVTLKRILGLPQSMSVRAGKKHLKVLDRSGRLILVCSKSQRGMEGTSLRAAKRKIADAA